MIFLVILCASFAFGQGKYKAINTITLYAKPNLDAFYIYAYPGSLIELGTQTGDFWQATYKNKLRYMPQAFLDYCIPDDSVRIIKYVPPKLKKKDSRAFDTFTIRDIENPDSIIVLRRNQKVMPDLPVDKLTGKITYSGVVTIDKITPKNKLYGHARKWFSKVFKSSNNSIQTKDRKSGKIVGKAAINIDPSSQLLSNKFNLGLIHFTITINLFEGKYQYVLTDFYHTGFQSSKGRIDYGPSEQGMKPPTKVYYSQKMDDRFYRLSKQLIDVSAKYYIASLKLAMATGSKSKTKTIGINKR